MTAAIPNFGFATGREIPAIGLGTWQSKPGEVAQAVKHALTHGYRHLDLAYCYGNEEEVGQGIRDSGVARSDIFLTGKVWCTYHSKVQDNLQATLNAIGTDYLDLYLIHWPVALNPDGNDPKFPTLPDGSRDIMHDWDVCTQTWPQMEELVRTGLVRDIGVSNFSVPYLERLLKTADIKPAVNQVEMHPYLDDILHFCRSQGIICEAYSPLGSTGGGLLKDEDVSRIAEKHSVGAGTVLISYQVQRGVVALPKSVTPARIESNLSVVRLEDSDMEILDSIQKRKTERFVQPKWGIKFGFGDGF